MIKLKQTSFAPQDLSLTPKGLRDLRADPLVFTAIHAAEQLEGFIDPENTACIVVGNPLWGGHLRKVLEAAKEKKVKPGLFSRMGPHTVATYVATVLGLHGPAFGLLHGSEKMAMEVVESLILSGAAKSVCLVVFDEKFCKVMLYDR